MTTPLKDDSRAVAYMRCSGLAQIQGDTWDRQEAAISKYSVAGGIRVERWFRDEGVTGKMELEGRGGLSDCLAYVRENGIKLVLVESSDRLARDMIVAEVVIREFQKIGVRVVAASGGLDLTAGDESNPTAKLVRQILAAVSEFDRCVIVLKTRAARDRIRAREGKCEGRKLYGDMPGESEVMDRMSAMRSAGRTLQEIADALNADGVAPRGTKKITARWHVGTVGKILARA